MNAADIKVLIGVAVGPGVRQGDDDGRGAGDIHVRSADRERGVRNGC